MNKYGFGFPMADDFVRGRLEKSIIAVDSKGNYILSELYQSIKAIVIIDTNYDLV